jgi:hypothetical protein
MLLIFDDAESHLSANIVCVAEENAINVYCILSIFTHTLQLLEKNVYSPFKKFWDEAVLHEWLTEYIFMITQVKFLSLFLEDFTQPRLRYQPIPPQISEVQTYTYPYYTSAIPKSAFPLSVLTNLPIKLIHCNLILIFLIVHFLKITLI